METEKVGERRRQRSSRRLRHEAEAKVFRDQAGTLEGIRLKLGFRPSQISEILKVHPSAWTRWVRRDNAPPHIYQMLEWYMELLEWRGQHTPVREMRGQAIRQQDPESYVPVEKEFKQSEKTDTPKGLRIMVFVWSIQALLWCILIGIVLKHR